MISLSRRSLEMKTIKRLRLREKSRTTSLINAGVGESEE
jgi:hypothetical protein